MLHLSPRESDGERRHIDIHQIDHLTIREYMAKLYEDKRKKSSIARKACHSADVLQVPMPRTSARTKPRAISVQPAIGEETAKGYLDR